ncbi:UNVERIFIED_CONTAM: protein ALTERED PHOSPHATE STARVATION RESPONSE 1 [Sesamum radiatum]|uniref:Protein ALTERED PHOSPHATE STARVATION RESPONSE 1 n=1 Tax=Sesamum radiatum TaxID=300843 RepID=A0AAW2KGM0_SESRA
MAMVVWSKKTLTGIVKDLDEYFLKASGIGKDIAVFIDIDAGGTFLYQNIKENKIEKWEISLALVNPVSLEPIALLFKNFIWRSRNSTRMLRRKRSPRWSMDEKSLLLERQEEEHDWTKAEKTRSAFESLHSYILSLQESIGRSSSTILMLISKELHPQLITLVSGLMHMWQTMHNCHQVQSHIAQQLSHLTDQQQNPEPTTESHQQAAGQLQTEVTSWHHSFSKLVKFQGMVSEAIKCLLSAVQSIVVQQQEECNLRKRSEKLGGNWKGSLFCFRKWR